LEKLYLIPPFANYNCWFGCGNSLGFHACAFIELSMGAGLTRVISDFKYHSPIDYNLEEWLHYQNLNHSMVWSGCVPILLDLTHTILCNWFVICILCHLKGPLCLCAWPKW
jgi:hypothetical protein